MFATNGTSFFVQAKYDGWREAVVTDVCFWHIADKRTQPSNGRYWGHSGQSWSLACVGYDAIDPYATSGKPLLDRSAAIASTPDGMVRPSAFAVMVQSGP